MPPNLVALWFEAAAIGIESSLTVTERVSRLSAAAARGRLLHEPELWRMGPEKLAVLGDGAVAATIAASNEMMRVAFDPTRLPVAGFAVAAAATKPARRRLRRNARRLAGPRP